MKPVVFALAGAILTVLAAGLVPIVFRPPDLSATDAAKVVFDFSDITAPSAAAFLILPLIGAALGLMIYFVRQRSRKSPNQQPPLTRDARPRKIDE